MKYLLIIIFTLFRFGSFAQPPALDSDTLHQVEISLVVEKLNVALKDSLIRGKSYTKFFGLVYDEKRDTMHLDSTIRSILIAHKPLKGGYNIHVYWDHFSDQVYSYLAKPAEIEIEFPNYENYEASPYGGYRKFIDSLKIDLLELLAEEDWYAANAFSSILEVLIDKVGHPQYLLNGKIQDLRRLENIKWHPALYYGQPRNHLLLVRLEKKYQDGKISNIIVDDNFSVGISYLEQRYRDNIVHLEPFTWNTQVPRGNIVVSFVYNAASKSFENPKIHQGESTEAKGFIRWLEAYDFSGYVFNWEQWPESRRYFFYYKIRQ